MWSNRLERNWAVFGGRERKRGSHRRKKKEVKKKEKELGL
jgi:hypothetical protein